MAGSYSGACKAIEDRLKAACLANGWPEETIIFEDGRTPEVIGPDRRLLPWVLCQIESFENKIRTVGGAGRRVTVLSGRINLTLFSPRAEDAADRDARRQAADKLSEIFRTVIFYDVEPGVYVRTWMPTIGPGNEARSVNPSGNWWAITIATPFEFFHRG